MPKQHQMTIMERIHSHLIFNDNGCWQFFGERTVKGYGLIWYQEKKQLVHRLVWRVMRGKIPKGLSVLHKCDNPPCCNPDHLFLGTQRDNMLDMYAKGRDYNSKVVKLKRRI